MRKEQTNGDPSDAKALWCAENNPDGNGKEWLCFDPIWGNILLRATGWQAVTGSENARDISSHLVDHIIC